MKGMDYRLLNTRGYVWRIPSETGIVARMWIELRGIFVDNVLGYLPALRYALRIPIIEIK
jgi:hypothetical protein